MDAERSDVYAEDSGPSGGATDWTQVRNGPVIDGDENALERTLAESETLKDHLLAQLSIAALDAERRLIAAALIDVIDEAGYLRVDLGELGERLGAEPPLVEEVLTIIQGFDPTGVGARDLAECLALQLREKGALRSGHAGSGRQSRSCSRAAISRRSRPSVASMPKISPT